MASVVRWFGDKIYGGFRRRVFLPRVVAAGDELLVAVRLNIGMAGPPHSKPGEYPRRVTGYMARAVDVAVDEKSLTARVFIRPNEAPYWKFHEMGKRPFLSRTLREMRPRIRNKLMVG